MKKLITSLLVAIMMISILPLNSSVKANSYSDQKSSKRYVATVTNTNRAQVYNFNTVKEAMIPVAGKRFELNSKWATDIKRTTANGIFYRVSSNEWLKSIDTIAPGFDIPENDRTVLTIAKNIMNNANLTYSLKYRKPTGLNEFLNGGNGSTLKGGADCSSFTWVVLKRAGYNVDENIDLWDTAHMEPDANGAHHYLQAIPKSEVQAGDLVIVNTGNGLDGNGHTAFLLDTPNKNTIGTVNDRTRVIQMGGVGNKVNINYFNTSFYSLLLPKHTITYVRPVSKI